MKLSVLLSAMFLDDENYIDTLGICSDAVVINQCDRESKKEVSHICRDGVKRQVTYVETTERGLSKSRNAAISNAKTDICILCDNDVEYEEGYEKIILDAFAAHEDADILVFFIKRPVRLKPNYDTEKRMGYLSVLKIFSPEIAFKRTSVEGIRFNEEFGAGAKYSMGEENIFLYDCLKAGKKIVYIPVKIATLREEESTWFKGYNREFFINRGANYEAMTHIFSHLLIWQFALRKTGEYGQSVSFINALRYMYEGRRQYRREK